jgi:malonyl CoA-acyl carrier protein transacylase
VRPLRELIGVDGPTGVDGPVEPLAVLSVVGRLEPAFDAARSFDRSLFGVRTPDLRALGPMAPHLAEVAYEALELSSLPFDRLGSLRFGTWVGSPGAPPWSARDGADVARLIGLPGPVFTVAEAGAGALLAMHAAGQAIRSQDVDIALVLGDVSADGVGAVVLGRPESVAVEGGRVRSVLLGSAVTRPGVSREPAHVAAVRAGVEVTELQAIMLPGLEGLMQALAAHAHDDRAYFVVRSASETSSAAIVLGPPEEMPVEGPGPWILRVSARSPSALQSLARRTAVVLATEDDLAAVASDALARPSFEYRAAVPARGVEDVRARLMAFAEGTPSRVAAGRSGEGMLAYVIPPAGAQVPDAGDELYATDPVFREAMNRCDRALRPVLKRRPLLSVLYPSRDDEVPLDEPEFANTATVALAWGLAEVLRSRGIVPAAVLGCGVGELAAAAICRAMDIEDALRIAARRGALLAELRGDAALAMIGVTEAQIRDLIVGMPGVDVVAVPMPDRVVVGGDSAAVDEVVESARQAGASAQLLTGHGAHTPLVDPIVADFERAARGVPIRQPAIPWISAATGRRVTSADPAYWGATLRAPLRFADGVGTLDALGCTVFLELAAQATLAAAGERTLALTGEPACWLTALDPRVPAVQQLGEVLSEMWVRGIDLHPGNRVQLPRTAELPTYPWDRREIDAPGAAARTPSDRPSPPPTTRHSERPADATPPPPRPRAPRASEQGATTLVPAGGGADHAPSLDDAQKGADRAIVWRDTWVEDPPSPPELSERTTWVILMDRGGRGQRLAARLSAESHSVLRVVHGTAPPGDGALSVPEPTARGAWEHVVEAIGTLTGRVRIVHLWALNDQDGRSADPGDGWAGLLAFAEELNAQGMPGAIHIVTRGAVLGPAPATATIGGALWGTAGVFASERSGVLHGIVDLDPTSDDGEALFTHLTSCAWPPPVALSGLPRREHALRGRQRLRRVVERVATVPEDGSLDTEGTWVLSGDVDGPLLDLGLHLVDWGVSRLMFLTVEPPPPEVLRGVLDLHRKGVSCLVWRADPTDRKELERVRNRLARDGRIGGIVLRSTPVPVRLDRLALPEAIAAYRRAVAEAEALLSLAPAAPFWYWSEARALDPSPGGGVGAIASAAISTALEARRTAWQQPTSVIHAGPAAALAQGQAARIVATLGRAGGVHGTWR